MSGAVGCMNANVMGNTWGIPVTAAKGIRYSPEDIVIGKFQGTLDIPWAAGFSNHYKLAVESLPPMLATEFGSARTARKQWPALEGLSCIPCDFWAPACGNLIGIHKPLRWVTCFRSSRQLLVAQRKRCHSFRPILRTSSWSKKSIHQYHSVAGCAS
jgi:hypothetical protein